MAFFHESLRFWRYLSFFSLSWLLLLSSLWPIGLHAGDIPDQPVIRLDGGMHTEPINRIGVDALNTTVASVSSDKTLRLWSLPTGKLIKTLRVPIAPGHEGELRAVAVAPEGSLIAVSGYTGVTWGGRYAIYLFDAISGKIRLQMGNLTEIINHMAFSPDGQYLATVAENNGGLRVFRVKDGLEVSHDSGYRGSSYWLDFDKKGRVVTASYDGLIRLYDPHFRLLVSKEVPKEYQPYSVAFSPDGSKIAVGFTRKILVAVFSGEDLHPLYTPDMTGAQKNLRIVAWSHDGQFLYGGGGHRDSSQYLVRWWSQGGQPNSEGASEYTDLPAYTGTITGIVPLNRGGIVFGSGTPALGMVDSQGFIAFLKTPPIIQFKGTRDALLVSENSDGVQFPYARSKGPMGRFSVKNLQLTVGQPTPADLLPPKLTSPQFVLRRGPEGFPQLNGVRVNLAEREVIISYAISRENRFLVMGTSFGLRLYDKTGQIRWQVATSGPVWAVNVSGNDHFVVAALGDGTLCWFKVGMGRLVLTLFPHQNQQQWIAWTPENYFASSSGGFDMIGWHKNQGRSHAADFYPASRFLTTYFKPQMVRQVIQ